MASASPSAGLVGNSFVGQYYNVLHQSPSVVYRFYNEESKLSRYDENGEVETVTTQQGINAKIMSMDFTSFKAEIKSVDSQNSLSGGVLVMVTGTLSCQSTGTRNFVQTFFLAPQEKGYFVLNDVFRYVEGGPAKSSPYSMANGVAESTVSSVPETDEQLTEEIEGEGEGVLPDEDHYDIIPEEAPVEEPEEELTEEPQLIEPPVVEAVPEEAPTPPTQSEEHGEPAKKSYASIVSELRGAVFQPKPKPAKSTPEKLPAPAQTSTTPPASTETPEESTPSSDSEVGDKRTVYVKNLPMNVSDQTVEAEFKKFGTLRAGGVQVRTHKQQGGCYAFVEFEDVQSAAEAVKAGTLEIEGRLAYIEEKKTAAPGARRFGSDRGGRGGGGGRGFYREGGGRGGEFGRDGGRYEREGGRGYEREGGGPRGYERGGFGGGGGGRPRRGGPSNEVDEGGFRRYDGQRSQRRGGNGNRNGRQE